MERTPNAVMILSADPFVAEVSDCLTCGAPVPDRTPWYESGSKDATARYRLCRSCLTASLYAVFMGGIARERAVERLIARLAAIGHAVERRTAILDSMPMQTRQ